VFPSSVDLLALDYPESVVIRALLEHIGVRVYLHTPGRPREVAAVLAGQVEPVAPHLIVACHGDEGGIVLEELDPSVAEGEPFLDRLTPGDIRAHGHLANRVVVFTGCGTGSKAFAEAAIAAGAAAFLAPDGYPSDAVFFVEHFYRALRADRGIEAAVRFAQEHRDEDALLFRLTMRSGASLLIS
jgi:hypothetical protein